MFPGNPCQCHDMVARANPSANRPSWVPDSSSTACARCRANFSFELRRHHCRFCGLIFCHYCSSKSRPVLLLGYVEPVRVCDLCHEQCALRDAFLEVVRSGDLRSTQAMLQHQHVGSDDSTGTQTPLLVAASKGMLPAPPSIHAGKAVCVSQALQKTRVLGSSHSFLQSMRLLFWELCLGAGVSRTH